ncbi:MAG: hypothetical protein JW889_03990 [Verrucomicrobia bacterium]|nr:hypothetical protein [Verrucomicrobiota bacterium]
MRIYEFECTVCGHQFEDLVGLSAKVRMVTCPKCGRKKGAGCCQSSP